MTASFQSSGSVTRSAIYRNGIVPEGRPVVVRIHHLGNFVRLNTNQAAVSIRYYRSSPPTSQGGSWAGTHCFSCALPAPLSSARGELRRKVNCMFRALHQACKQASRVFSILFRPHLLLSVLPLHGSNHGAGHVGKIRNYVGAENELR